MPSRVERGSEHARQMSDLLRRRRAADGTAAGKRMYRNVRKQRRNLTNL